MSVDTAVIDGRSLHRANDTFIVRWGGLGTPEVREVRYPAPMRDGAVDLTSLYGPRIMPVRGFCAGATPAATVAAFDALKALLLPGTSHLAVIRRHGRSADEQMVVRVASAMSDDGTVGGTLIEWGVDLVAADPLLYGTTLNSQSTTTTTLTIPTVGGTVPTPATLTVRGPTNAGALALAHGGKTINLSGLAAMAAWASGETNTVVVDLLTRTVRQNGTENNGLVVSASTDWWKLTPGSSQAIAISGTARQASTALVASWREARI